MSHNSPTAFKRYIRETDPVYTVITIGPSTVVRFGIFQGSNIQETLQSYDEFKKSLSKHNIKVKEIQECFKSLSIDKLRTVVSSCLTYQGGGFSDFENALSHMTKHQLIEMLILNPKIYLEKTPLNTQISSIELSPVPNLMFTRNQQITTNAGVVLGTMRAKIHQREKNVMKTFFEDILNVPIFELIPDEGAFLEGGDFYPMGSRFSFIGIGLRSNIEAVYQIMFADKFGTPYVAVIKDLFDRNQQRLHLDNIFNVITTKTVVVLDNLYGERQRLIDVYYQDPESRIYFKQYYDIDFYDFLENWLGLNTIKVNDQQQKDYIINFVNLGNNKLLVSNEQTGKFFQETIKKLEEKDLEIIFVDYKGVTAMFGGPHCSTQVVRHGKDFQEDDVKIIKENPYHKYLPVSSNQRRQVTDTVVMIPPTSFGYNKQTATDNAFMTHNAYTNRTNSLAMTEFGNLRRKMIEKGINVITPVNDDERTLDAVFPNNWFSTHPGEECPSTKPTLILYPMKAQNRRIERKPHIIKELQQRYVATEDISTVEVWGSRLEGTGVLILDRINKIAYAAHSERCTQTSLKDFCQRMGYKSVCFYSTETIYHTNVMMALGEKWAVLCTELVVEKDRKRVLENLQKYQKEVIEISREQVNKFCGNIIELANSKGERFIVMSTTSLNGFTPQQKEIFKKLGLDFIAADFTEIEQVGGGGVRCTIAEIF